MRGFKQREKYAHYKAVVTGEKALKKGSKFTAKEQKSYARGQKDARDEQRRIYAWKNASPAERKAYKEAQRIKRAEYKRKKSEG